MTIHKTNSEKLQSLTSHESARKKIRELSATSQHTLPMTPALLPYISGMSVLSHSERQPRRYQSIPLASKFHPHGTCIDSPISEIADTALDWMNDDERINTSGMSIYCFSRRQARSNGLPENTYWSVQLQTMHKPPDIQMMDIASLILLAVIRANITDVKTDPNGGNTFIKIKPWCVNDGAISKHDDRLSMPSSCGAVKHDLKQL